MATNSCLPRTRLAVGCLTAQPPSATQQRRARQQRRQAPPGSCEGSHHTLGRHSIQARGISAPSLDPPRSAEPGARRQPRAGPPAPTRALVALRRNEVAPEVPDADALHRPRSDHRSRARSRSTWTARPASRSRSSASCCRSPRRRRSCHGRSRTSASATGAISSPRRTSTTARTAAGAWSRSAPEAPVDRADELLCHRRSGPPSWPAAVARRTMAAGRLRRRRLGTDQHRRGSHLHGADQRRRQRRGRSDLDEQTTTSSIEHDHVERRHRRPTSTAAAAPSAEHPGTDGRSRHDPVGRRHRGHLRRRRRRRAPGPAPARADRDQRRRGPRLGVLPAEPGRLLAPVLATAGPRVRRDARRHRCRGSARNRRASRGTGMADGLARKLRPKRALCATIWDGGSAAARGPAPITSLALGCS